MLFLNLLNKKWSRLLQHTVYSSWRLQRDRGELGAAGALARLLRRRQEYQVQVQYNSRLSEVKLGEAAKKFLP